MRKRIKPGDLIPVTLSRADLDLVVEIALVDTNLTGAFRPTEKEAKLMGMLTLDDLDEFIDSIAAAANHAPDRGAERKLDRVFDRLRKLQRSYDDGMWNDS